MPRPYVRYQEEANVSTRVDERFAETVSVIQEKTEEAWTEDRDVLWLHWNERAWLSILTKGLELFT